MLVEEVNIVCEHCGRLSKRHTSVVQMSRRFDCDHCGRPSLINKDRVSTRLASLELNGGDGLQGASP